jgi:retron-type reverse transcriptase
MFVIFKSIILVTAWLNESDDGCMAERGNASLQNSANGCGTPVMGVHSGCRFLGGWICLPMGPSTADVTRCGIYAKEVWKKNTLYNAWHKVRANGIRSGSPDIRREIEEYGSDILHKIASLTIRLSKNTFKFAPSRGVPLPRKGKSPRPIVVAPTENKIVQRAILDVLQTIPAMSNYVKSPNSFGGIKDADNRRSVSSAVSALLRAIEDGCKWFVKSDIKNFFVGIPREKVVAQVESLLQDTRFVDLFRRAMEVELENMAKLGTKSQLFPIHEIGVAQGCCLSPFVGNVLLHDFDVELNQRGVQCLRYIDDFIILGHTLKGTKKAFSKALEILAELGLEAYNPISDQSKTSFGRTEDRIEFLGVEIVGDQIQPTKEARDRLLGKIDTILSASVIAFREPKKCYADHYSLIETLRKVDHTLDGWVGQYKFCNDSKILERLNRAIEKRLNEYFGRYIAAKRKYQNDVELQRSLLGVRFFTPEDWRF